MEESSPHPKRRLTGFAAVVTSVAAVVGGWGLVSWINTNQAAQASMDTGTAAAESAALPATQPTFRERQPRRPGAEDAAGSLFGGPPAQLDSAQSQAPSAPLTQPRTRSSQ
ncbi:MAG: hypothetical protein KA764_12675 [Anaerolineales bacterium]|nr:hypothetical protein [Anaerolineales bacterium]